MAFETKKSNSQRYTYEKVKSVIEKEGCELITSQAEHNEKKMTTKSLLSVKMCCSHVTSCSLNTFQRRRHYKCETCIFDHMKVSAYDNDTRVAESNKLEAAAFDYIKNNISMVFDVKKTHEGCLTDMIIKPKNILEDEWAGIQIKSSSNNKSQISFGKIDKYPDIVVVCVSFPERKVWVFQGNGLLGKKTISIGKKKSKYDEHETDVDDLTGKLLGLYQITIKRKSMSEYLTPVTPTQKKEHEYRLRREILLHWCDFEYPKVDGTKYDVIINGYKIQDKTGIAAVRGLNTYYYCNIANGYIKNDNHYYWINMPDNTFYIIPQEYLLMEDNTIKNKIYLSGNKYAKFLYDPNVCSGVREKLERLFEKSPGSEVK